MSDSIPDEGSPYWQTPPEDASVPAFPIEEQLIPPLIPTSPTIPAPPPPPFLPESSSPPSPPAKQLAFSAGIGLIAGIALTVCAVLAVLSVLIANGSLAHFLGFSTHAPKPGLVASGTRVPTLLPTSTQSTPKPTAAAPVLPLQVRATAADGKRATMMITTRPGATMTITVTYCNGVTDHIYNGLTITTPSGIFTSPLFPPHCGDGNDPSLGIVSVTARLAGFQIATTKTPITNPGQGG